MSRNSWTHVISRSLENFQELACFSEVPNESMSCSNQCGVVLVCWQLGTASPVHQMLETAVSQDPTRSPRSSPKVDNLVSSPLNRPKREVVGDGSVTLKGRPCNKLKSGGWKSAAFVYGRHPFRSTSCSKLSGHLSTSPHTKNFTNLCDRTCEFTYVCH